MVNYVFCCVNIRIVENIEMCGVFVYIKLYKSRTKSTSNKVKKLKNRKFESSQCKNFKLFPTRTLKIFEKNLNLFTFTKKLIGKKIIFFLNRPSVPNRKNLETP